MVLQRANLRDGEDEEGGDDEQVVFSEHYSHLLLLILDIKIILSNFVKIKIFQVHTLHLIQLVAVAVLLSLVSVIYTLLKMSFCLTESWNLMQKCKIVDFRLRRSIGQEGHARQIMNILKSQK